VFQRDRNAGEIKYGMGADFEQKNAKGAKRKRAGSKISSNP
jgi:hypothetical protein